MFSLLGILLQFIFTCGSSALLRDAQIEPCRALMTTACFFKGCYTFLPSQLRFTTEEEHSTFQFCFFLYIRLFKTRYKVPPHAVQTFSSSQTCRPCGTVPSNSFKSSYTKISLISLTAEMFKTSVQLA